ncbi:bifunctional hydroxymethylpyrimidine kinase/phosphomethylpyrimidine kinase [Aquibacillus koreensis]|uniref:Hydroxymethylpyrimidine/phosphomethylpyrimidine kinase n=1 Tax=Aquibacillus koreensis TaxID=279446 RepID=A0A9X3WRM4_9BACI|nr:bifunctional hydroxymethylpyrimidine kinase/phosphomethylpyrimidine kinase [Aquibacillus koreensis]MCT2536205.1 bifunctional hydroxymethylpyrimidine kinase/phosphomethylpyrimidine kinase [Aquibacillus koreensis]MDC3422129.1 bifunctional hydroxymethylpyrimidine kinase/phosphomethylpyrimidine kinase [Aquibacillus koreensis]
MKVASALTIAGTDPTGGAGIQADLKSFQEREVYGMSVVTSVVAQNTLGVQSIQHLPVDFIEKQLHAVFEDITPDAVKTGMIATIDMMEMIAKNLKDKNVHYVIDPVMVAKSGHSLMEEQSREVIRKVLVPLATVVTPNVPEAESLVGFEIHSTEDAEKAAKVIVNELGSKAAVVKGGHLVGEAIDVLYDGKEFSYFKSERFDTKHTHGTGCTFSAVITAELAKGKPIAEAVATGKAYISDAIKYTLGVGKGNGPTNHWGYRLKGLPNQ